jgi:hypothetical protein
MNKKTQQYVLAGLVLAMVLVYFLNRSSGPSLVGVTADDQFHPLKVDDPSLRLDLLEHIRNIEYGGTHRNIFTGEAPPPPPEEVKKMKEEAAKRQAEPQGPPPVSVPAKFFGYAVDPRTGEHRAFFTANDDVYVVAQGGILLNNFRIMRINNSSVDVQEISSGRQTTLAMDVSAAPAGFGGLPATGGPPIPGRPGLPGRGNPPGGVPEGDSDPPMQQ